VATSSTPGQFLQIRVTEELSPFLRIPLSISGVDPSAGVVEILYEVMGPKSEALARARPGDLLSCLGPLGKGFDPPGAGRVILVGGGIGVPPLLYLGRQARSGGCDVRLLVGARTARKLLPASLLDPAAEQVLVATDDGSEGHSGMVTDLLVSELDSSTESAVFACGPHGMMARVAAVCQEFDVACEVSLEEYMACGFGVCVGCVVEVTGGADLSDYARYSRVCVDGPVFDARGVVWDRP
jgi:dihydroorotate dehydrogenase electron transfer subunit